MKLSTILHLIVVALAAMLFPVCHSLDPMAAPVVALMIITVGFAALSKTSYRSGHFATNVIADDLKLTEVLDAAIVGLEAALAPLEMFSTEYVNDPITPGNDDDNSVTVPVYDQETDESIVKDRSPGTAYSSLVTGTETKSRKLKIDKEKVVGLSFTAEEAQNQTRFNPEMHGLIKGHMLAQVVLKDIFSVARYGYFNSDTLAPVAYNSFDTNDVADWMQKGMEANWLQFPQPGLVLNPAYHFNLVKQPAILDASQAGSADALRQARIGQIMGAQQAGSNGIPLNNGVGQTFTAANTDICTAAAHGYLTGDQVQVTTSAADLPAGLAVATYYYVIKLTADTFKLAASLADAMVGTPVDITDAGTGVHTIALKTNLVGVLGARSGIITGFRPVLPTVGQRQKLIDFQLVKSAKTGLTLEYRYISDEDKGVDYQIIGVHYGKTYGLASSLKLLSKPAA